MKPTPYLITLTGLCLYFTISCGTSESQSDVIAVKDIKYTNIDIDTVNIYMDNSSYSGFSGVHKDKLYFFDEFFSYYYDISIEGQVADRYIGLGKGPKEIPIRSSIEVCTYKDEFLAFGGNNAYLLKNFENTKPLVMNLSGDVNSYDASAAYTLWPQTTLRMNDKAFFYNIAGSHDAVDPIAQKDYFANARILMKVDLQTMNSTPIGKYSDYYIKNSQKLRHLVFYNYDIDNEGQFYITYQADSVIYVYDKKFTPVKKIGFQGSNMNVDYSDPSGGPENMEKAFMNDINKGYYYWLEHIDNTGLTFRSYQKGSHTEDDGLQIFKNDKLIADVEVPKNFKVTGYIAPYYVTKIICDEEKETMKFYRFILE